MKWCVCTFLEMLGLTSLISTPTRLPLPPLAVNSQLPPHLTSPVTRWGTPQTCVQSFSLLLADHLKHAKSLLFTPPNTRTHDRHFDLYLHKAFLSFYILHGFPFGNASLVKITSNQTIYFSTLGARFFLNLILHITTMFYFTVSMHLHI